MELGDLRERKQLGQSGSKTSGQEYYGLEGRQRHMVAKDEHSQATLVLEYQALDFEFPFV